MADSPARNYRVFAGKTPLGGTPSVYTVPLGYVLILKAIWMHNPGAAQDYHGVVLACPDVQVYLYQDYLQPTKTWQWNGWQVMNAEDSIMLFSQNVDMPFWVAGALLGGFTGVPVGAQQLPSLPAGPFLPPA